METKAIGAELVQVITDVVNQLNTELNKTGDTSATAKIKALKPGMQGTIAEIVRGLLKLMRLCLEQLEQLTIKAYQVVSQIDAGMAMADFAIRALGEIGSFFIISVLIVITSLLVIDRDFQKSMDRLEDAALNFRDLFKDWGAIIRQDVFGNRKERRRLLEEEREKQRTDSGVDIPPVVKSRDKKAKTKRSLNPFS